MIESIEIGYIRSFGEVQCLSLALPDKTRGSGYNLIVGKNNAGKSTIVKVLRDLISNQNVLTVGMESRHDPKRPHLTVRWRTGNETENLSFAPTETGGLFTKSGPYQKAEPLFRYVPSRRPFHAEFSSLSGISPIDCERNDFFNRRSNVGYFDSQCRVVSSILNRSR
jgi:energy-coupling factor transporter ATP-binding protein EcfA2